MTENKEYCENNTKHCAISLILPTFNLPNMGEGMMKDEDVFVSSVQHESEHGLTVAQ